MVSQKASPIPKAIFSLIFLTPGYFAFTHLLLVTAAPYIQSSLQVSVIDTSYLIGGFPLGLSCGMLLFGHLVDKYGTKLVYYLGPAFISLTAVANYLFSDHITLLTVTHFFQAFGVASVILSARVSLHRFAKGKASQLARYYSIEKVSCFTYDCVTPYIAALFIILWGWPKLNLVIIPLALAFIASFHYFSADSALFDSYEKKAQKFSFALIIKNSLFFRFTMLGMTNYAWLYFYYVCVPFHLINTFQISSFWYAVALSTNLIFAVVGSFVNLRLLHHFSVFSILLGGTITTLASSVVLLLASFLVTDLLFLFILLFICMRLTITITTTNSMTLAINSCRPEFGGKATAVFGSFCYASGFLSGIASGYVLNFPYDDMTSTLVWLVVINLVAVWLCLLKK